MDHPNVKLLSELYDARARNDRQTIRRIVAENVAWYDPYPDSKIVEAWFHPMDKSASDAFFA